MGVLPGKACPFAEMYSFGAAQCWFPFTEFTVAANLVTANVQLTVRERI
jgi:hypothetical protein